MPLYPCYDVLDLKEISREVLGRWRRERTFQQSLERNLGKERVIFYEGPPGANGAPGVHHLLPRVLKDILCRYYTMRGRYVERRSGWDAHGLPVELAVEKALGLTKEDVGTKISIEAYNERCKEAVMRYKEDWERMTEEIGYWVDLENPYVTYDNGYISVLWDLLKRLYRQGLLYKGLSIQPYSPGAGTGLSAHELNQPGCYKEVKDTSVVAQFAVHQRPGAYLLAWTTTPWTLPANSALAVGADICYVCVETYHRYTGGLVRVILAEEALGCYFDASLQDAPMAFVEKGPQPWKVVERYRGAELAGWTYDQLLPYVVPEGPAFRVVVGDFVTTSEGTGVVHIAPTFGADDARVAAQAGVPSITVAGPDGRQVPIVDRQGRFVAAVTDFAGEYVKEAYKPETEQARGAQSVDLRIALKLKEAGKAFLIAPYTHSYPHCWRTDKPILYYPLEAWFIRTTAYKERLVALNKMIGWYPPGVGEKRFGNWLEHVVDWNLTRSRFWGTPLPIWSTADGSEEICIGSVEELRAEVDRAVAAGVMERGLGDGFDLHRPYVDKIVLVGKGGKKMYRVPDVVDVWFDSGAMPYAQHGLAWHLGKQPPASFPADFIVEGVDQTRGWFFTLHVLSVLLFDQIAFKNVLATGFVVDRQGNKMSKRLGNTLEPGALLREHGPDVVRWYMVTNSPPWENLKFDVGTLPEVKNRFFRALHNTYQFFALYASLACYRASGSLPLLKRASRMDRWILSCLQGLIRTVEQAMEGYNPTQAGRAIQDFTIELLSNWYVRLNRKRFWGENLSEDRAVALETLHYCLVTVVRLAAPIAPFYMERLYADLHPGGVESVHLADFPVADGRYDAPEIEEQMVYAQKACSLGHRLRKQHGIKVRQPLACMLIPVRDEVRRGLLEPVAALICAEVNVKEVRYVTGVEEVVEWVARPNFARLAKRYGAELREIGAALAQLGQGDIRRLQSTGVLALLLPTSQQRLEVALEDVLLTTRDVPGWAVASDELLAVALDLRLTPALINEGKARELVSRLQQVRRELGLAITDKVAVRLAVSDEGVREAVEQQRAYIMEGVQITSLEWSDQLEDGMVIEVEGASVGVEMRRVEVP